MAEKQQQLEYAAQLRSACRQFQAFLAKIEGGARIVVLHDSDADGVTAGVVLERALARAGYGPVTRVAPDRERNAWTEGNRARVRAHDPQVLFVLDLGASGEPIIPHVPVCFVDHHRPEGVPPGGTLISAYEWTPVPNTSLMIYELSRSITEIEDLEWIAAIGTFSDLGERAPFEIVSRAKITLRCEVAEGSDDAYQCRASRVTLRPGGGGPRPDGARWPARARRV